MFPPPMNIGSWGDEHRFGKIDIKLSLESNGSAPSAVAGKPATEPSALTRSLLFPMVTFLWFWRRDP